jgi:hypothetical protein
MPRQAELGRRHSQTGVWERDIRATAYIFIVPTAPAWELILQRSSVARHDAGASHRHSNAERISIYTDFISN